MNNTVVEKKLIIYGPGCLAEILLADDAKHHTLAPVCFTADREFMRSDVFHGLPVIPFEDIVGVCPPSEYDMLVVCDRQNLRRRMEMYHKAKDCGYRLINYISPEAHLEPGITIGDNNLIFSGARLGHDGCLGSHNVIRQDTYIGHEFSIGDGNMISVHCTIGSMCHIGNCSYFGMSVTSRDHNSFGSECLVGMGSVVTKPVEEYATAYGVPAKTVSYHKETGVIF